MPLDGDPKPEEIYPGEGSRDPAAILDGMKQDIETLVNANLNLREEADALRKELAALRTLREKLESYQRDCEGVGKGPGELGFTPTSLNRAYAAVAEYLKKLLEGRA